MPGIYVPSQEGSLRQGEIVTDLKQARLVVDSVEADIPELEFQNHPFAIVLSQDCDLDQDFRARQQEDDGAVRRLLPSVLFAEVHEAVDLKGQVVASALWKRIVQNKDERYHFLESIPPTDDAVGEGLPELGIDFKRYLTIATDEVYKQVGVSALRRCRLTSPYLEHLSTRFCYYQFRVALPAEHQSM